jgi:hypothetical protein
MSFLSDLKSQASELQKKQAGTALDTASQTQACERACNTLLHYIQELCAQLNVINPPAIGQFSLDGKAQFPSMVLANFRSDARKKTLRNAQVYDYIGVGWDGIPATGKVATHSVAVNFPPDLERVIKRLGVGGVQHERKETRHPTTQKLTAYVFEYETRFRGSLMATPNHDTGHIAFRGTCMGGLELLNTTYLASDISSALLDEMAKKIIGHLSRFG